MAICRMCGKSVNRYKAICLECEESGQSFAFEALDDDFMQQVGIVGWY
ncbi:MAG: hypothetical protein QF824_02895 [Candidatus Woesearchaeota archaeon]|nr:hypothetical protein [Candidatus Woesearchaeota archaeon]